MKKYSLFFFLLIAMIAGAQQQQSYIILKPDRVFDGEKMYENLVVIVINNKIEVVAEKSILERMDIDPGMKIIELKGMTLLPGLIEGHSHLFLHPYNERSWDDQVLKESRQARMLIAEANADTTLKAGFTTVRDLGTEGAMYDDVLLKRKIDNKTTAGFSARPKKQLLGPRMIIATRAIVLTGTYGPKSEDPKIKFPQAAAEVATADEMIKEVRTEIGNGADLVKVYADYRLVKDGNAVPTFSQELLEAAVKTAADSGKQVVAHATTPEGMRRAIMTGVRTIEHGDRGTEEVFKLMKEKGVALCPTLAAGDAVEQYKGWKKGIDPEPERVINKRKTFALALQAGVTICMGGDVGVFAHGDNAREMEMMVEYGMKPLDVLRSATSVNADVFGYANLIGRIKTGLLADLIAVEGDPSVNIKDIRKIKLVMKDGVIYKQP